MTKSTGGIDWASQDHAVAIVDPGGQQTDRFTVTHDAEGLATVVRKLLAAGVLEVGIERPDGPVVDALRQAGLIVYVIPPGQVKNLRSRYGSAGNKDDRFDAYVLADVVRTDHARLQPLHSDTAATTALRHTVRARKHLVSHRIAVTNQLRAHLQVYFPGVIGLFSDLDSPISLSFLTRFTTQHRADWLTPKRLANWLATARYSGRTDPAVLYQRLHHAARGTTGADAEPAATITRAFVATLRALHDQIESLATNIANQLHHHPDGAVFTSLPRANTLRAARLIAEIGDARGRFPTADSLACLAGVAPSTRQSGKLRVVTFRWGADKHLRDALCDFAGDTRHDNPWAENLYRQARNRGHDHPHAVRILARSWVDILWRCWHTNTPYNPDHHRALQRILNQDQLAAG